MKTILTLTTALCLVAGAAQAGGSHEQQHGQAAQPVSTTYNTATMHQGQAQGQMQTQRQGQAQVARGGNAAAQGGSAAGGNATGGRGGNAAGGAGGSANNGGQTMNYSGGGYSARGNTPDVILGSVSGGNPCGLGAGAGGSGPGAGGLLSFMWEGGGCQRLEDAKLLHNMGYDAAAKERLCQDTTFSNAFARAGQPCAADVARWQAAGYRQRQDGYWVVSR